MYLHYIHQCVYNMANNKQIYDKNADKNDNSNPVVDKNIRKIINTLCIIILLDIIAAHVVSIY